MPICCKVAEHITVSQTMRHIDVHNILVDCQHGFRRKRSCKMHLLITTHDLAAILNRHSQADVAVLDFAKAFDKVPHHPLLRKLKYYNLDKNVVGWVSSFLTGRTQIVVVDDYTSSEAAVLSGVPQGTVLGPVLFLVFMNDIIQGSSSSIHLFADDCLAYHEIRSKWDCSALQSDLDNLVQWSKTWGMEFNISKCNILSVTNATKNKIKHQYTMDDQALKTQDSTECLGVTINCKLHWNQHINDIIGTASKLISFLWRTMHRCLQDLKSKAYTTLVRPKIEYSFSVCDPHHQMYINQLDMVQWRAAPFVKNNPYRRSENPTSVTAMVEELGWDSLQNRRLHSRLTIF